MTDNDIAVLLALLLPAGPALLITFAVTDRLPRSSRILDAWWLPLLWLVPYTPMYVATYFIAAALL
jgi:hypothetical protein